VGSKIPKLDQFLCEFRGATLDWRKSAGGKNCECAVQSTGLGLFVFRVTI
jgi:hypothetical protein